MVYNAMDNKFSMSHHEHHQSLDRCIDYLKKIYSVDLQGVILWHLSNSNIDENRATQRVKNELAFSNVYVAKPNLEIELNKSEF
jgi:hypothetical protein